MQVRVGVPALPAEDQILFQIIEGDRRSVAIASLGDTLGRGISAFMALIGSRRSSRPMVSR